MQGAQSALVMKNTRLNEPGNVFSVTAKSSRSQVWRASFSRSAMREVLSLNEKKHFPEHAGKRLRH